MKIVFMLSACLLLLACSKDTSNPNTENQNLSPTASPSSLENNPLIAEWTGPYGGVPPFDRVNIEDFEPALQEGMRAQLDAVAAIVEDAAEPTFDNTILPLERSAKTLNQVRRIYNVWSANLSSPEFREVASRMAPELSAHQAAILQNNALFARISQLYSHRDQLSLTPEQTRVLTLTYERFVSNGATLSGADKARYSDIQQALANLQTKFANNVLADEEEYVLYLSSEQLGGLPDSYITSAAAAADQRGHVGEYAVTNTRSSIDPFLTYSSERGLRQQVWETYYNRGNNNDANDNKAIIADILALRHERSQLLGFPNYASWRLQDRMAKTPENALDLMHAVWPAALARVEQEVADMQAIADSEGAGIHIEPWDYRYYAEKVRASRYDLDSNEVKQYLQLDKLVDAMFYVAETLFDFQFIALEAGTVPVFHPDVEVWEVRHKSSGEHVGLWYFDPFARPGKRSGAWATTYRNQHRLDGENNVFASNNSNFINNTSGAPVLISWSDAETLFHEFGHALHTLTSDVTYPSSQNVVRDYVEFQSQVLERWLLTDPIINNYLIHSETGQPIPSDLVEKIRNAATFNQGFATTEYLASALMDMRYHTTDPSGIEVAEFERTSLQALGMPDELPMRHRSTQFMHIFSSEGYAAGYYGYLWADVLTSDTVEAFRESPLGFYDLALASRMIDLLFAPRNAIDPAQAYRQFRGRDATIEPLMRDRGFPVPSSGDEP